MEQAPSGSSQPLCAGAAAAPRFLWEPGVSGAKNAATRETSNSSAGTPSGTTEQGRLCISAVFDGNKAFLMENAQKAAFKAPFVL